MIPREDQTDLSKQEINTSTIGDDHHHNPKLTLKASSSSSSWSRLKDPRIVRVSRAFGGKDRHSKVCTVRGLRDRRVRLSVPTAIQLYDLQDRLGLNQPSKVVDWLLNAAKHEIDELPPLQIPEGMMFNNELHPMLNSHHDFGVNSQSAKQGLKNINWNSHDDHVSSNDFLRGKSKGVPGETSDNIEDQERQLIMNLENHQGAYHVTNNHGSNFHSSLRQIPTSLPNLSSSPYNSSSFLRWDPSNLSLSHPPPIRSPGLTTAHQHEANNNWPNFSLVSLRPTFSNNHNNQVLVYHQPGLMSTQSYFPSQMTNSEFEPNKQLNNFQSSQILPTSSLSSPSVDHSTAQPVRPIHSFNMMTANLLPSHNNEGK